MEPRFEDAQVVELAWGVPHSPEAFVAAAVKAGHPKTLKPPLPEPLQRAVNLNKQLGQRDWKSLDTNGLRNGRHVRSNLNLMNQKSKVVCLSAFAIY